jgi:hypothetical protein
MGGSNGTTACLVPSCGKPNTRGSRGLCPRCRTLAAAEVNSGRTTWDELERLGLARPPKKRPNIFAAALLKRQAGREEPT